MLKKIILTSALVLAMSATVFGQTAQEFKAVSDSLTSMTRERTTVRSSVRIDKVIKKDKTLDFYFTQAFSDFHWNASDIEWLRKELKNQMPAMYKKYKVGNLYCKGTNVNDLINPDLTFDGKPSGKYKYTYADPRATNAPFITEVGAKYFQKGLSGRYVALWQSHGRYYEQNTHRWEWQRAPLNTTVEDMYTQSYVIPFLIPMLENAGAYVMTPRERDTQKLEVITDNDPSFTEERDGDCRQAGTYSEIGAWESAGTGFADTKKIYMLEDNPFEFGTARQIKCVAAGKKGAEARWTPIFAKRGTYCVYISYKSLPNSTKNAHYTVHHMGGDTEFIVNQQAGGSSWIYLGTFEFNKGSEGYVTLDNVTPEGCSFEKKTVVTADAVKIGGGMGKIARGMDDEPVDTYTTSGLPAFTEGAMYWMPWAGTPTDLVKYWDRDYTNDYGSRGAWVDYMHQKGIPFDVSLGFHTDAGSNMNDDIVGVLSIYTLMAEQTRGGDDVSRMTPYGIDRMTCRLVADYVQDQIIRDIRPDFEPEFAKRYLWDRSYSESRTTAVPGMLLELLSHHNMADMKYGLDPTFRFTVSRAIYKGFLKFMSEMYGCPYVVQPLAVDHMSLRFSDCNKAVLSWNAVKDEKEPTADPTSFIVYTRIDGGGFDKGQEVTGTSVELPIEPGHIYSYKVVAVNEGGRSFPSEILSIGMPEKIKGGKVLVVNNFTRISSPVWYESDEHSTIAGFDSRNDAGVPYLNEINFIGHTREFRHFLPWTDDDNPGFNACDSDYAGMVIAGNSFDYPYIHGKALLANGLPFCSQSRSAFMESDPIEGISTTDLICGKQVTVKIGRGAVPDRYQVFPEALQSSVKKYADKGVNFIVSGANISTDVWQYEYPIKADSAYTANTKAFIENVFGYKWLTSFGSYTGAVEPVWNKVQNYGKTSQLMPFWNTLNEECYCVENPDGLNPANDKGTIVLKYSHNNIPAAILYDQGTYKVASFGFPIEVLKCDKDIEELFKNTFNFIK